MMKQMTKYRKLNSGIASFLLALCFCILQLSAGCYMGPLNRSLVLQQLQESKYYENSYETFLNQVQDELFGSEIPLSVISDQLTFQQFYIEEHTTMKKALQGSTFHLQSQEKKEVIVQAISTYYEQNGNTITLEISNQIDQACEHIIDEYQSSMELHFLSILENYRHRMNQICAIVLPIAILILITLFFSIFHLYHHRHKALRYLAYAILSASMITTALVLYLSHTYDYHSVVLGPDYYRAFLNSYLSQSRIVFFYPAIIGVLLFIVLLLVIQRKRRRLMGEE